jgi:hypothetical protein
MADKDVGLLLRSSEVVELHAIKPAGLSGAKPRAALPKVWRLMPS